MKRTMISLFLSASLAACAHQELAGPTPVPGEYNAALAEELGADEFGMRSYILVILQTGPNDTTIKDEERAAIFKGHFANMAAQADAGKLAMAGPFSDPAGIQRGVYVFNVETVEEAKTLVLTDPAVKVGIFTAEFLPFYGSAALMQVQAVHKTIARKNPG